MSAGERVTRWGRLRCWWSGHTDHHSWPGEWLTCGRCGALLPKRGTFLKGTVTIHRTRLESWVTRREEHTQ